MGAGPRGIGEPAPRPAPRVSTPLTTADPRSRGGTGGRDFPARSYRSSPFLPWPPLHLPLRAG